MIIASKNLSAQNKTISKIVFLASLVVSLLFSFCSTAQIKAYLPLLNRVDSCLMYKIDAGKKLYHIVFKKDINFRNNDVCGWLQEETAVYYQFISITGSETKFRKDIVEKIVPCKNNEEILSHIENNDTRLFYCGQTILPYIVVSAWAHKNNNLEFALQLAEKAKDKKLDAASIRDYVGYMYYDDMLVSYSLHRNYEEAALYGEHLGSKAFEGFEYREEAITLAKQLRSRKADFKIFTLPDSVKWQQVKAGWSRKDQLLYLVDKMHLLNCIQIGQPSGISYDAEQTIISSDSISTLIGHDWTRRRNYPSINPFNELLLLNPSPAEVALLVPALLDSSYIPTFTYHRDFKCDRTLHRYCWAVNELIFRITNKRFIDDHSFDEMAYERKKQEVDEVLEWCRENNGLSEKERLHKILLESATWEEFRKALQISLNNRDSSITDILPQRLGKDAFMGWSSPSYDGIMASTMFELSSGCDRDKQVINEWRNTTTDGWVRFWSTMFLIKFDKANEELHLSGLAALLQKCDSTSSVYPYAIKVLFLKDDLNSRKVAEASLNTKRIDNMLNGWTDRDILRLLFINGCDKVFNTLYDGLNNFERQPQLDWVSNGQEIQSIRCDQYISVVEQWRNPGYDYKNGWPMKQRRQYAHDLSKWLERQYNLIKAGKESDIILDTRYMKNFTTESFMMK